MNWCEKVCTVGNKHGVSVPEFIVLDEVRLKVPLRPKQMARFLVKEYGHLDEVKYTSIDYEVAIESCIDKGWLRVLTAKEVKRQPPSYSAYPTYHPTNAGLLDFTPLGHNLAHCLLKEFLGFPKAER